MRASAGAGAGLFRLLFLGCFTIWLANALAAIVRATGHMQVEADVIGAKRLLELTAVVRAMLHVDLEYALDQPQRASRPG